MIFRPNAKNASVDTFIISENYKEYKEARNKALEYYVKILSFASMNFNGMPYNSGEYTPGEDFDNEECICVTKFAIIFKSEYDFRRFMEWAHHTAFF